MNRDRFGNLNNRNDGPVCKFGPGGDFIRQWPKPKSKVPPEMDNPLGKILSAIAEMIGTTIHPELLTQVDGPYNINGQLDTNLIKEKTSGADTKSDNTDNTAATGRSKANSKLPSQSMLFGDDCRTRRPVRRKPHYRIRTHRGASKKRSADKLKGQGTLFEVNPTSQSAA